MFWNNMYSWNIFWTLHCIQDDKFLSLNCFPQTKSSAVKSSHEEPNGSLKNGAVSNGGNSINGDVPTNGSYNGLDNGSVQDMSTTDSNSNIANFMEGRTKHRMHNGTTIVQ